MENKVNSGVLFKNDKKQILTNLITEVKETHSEKK